MVSTAPGIIMVASRTPNSGPLAGKFSLAKANADSPEENRPMSTGGNVCHRVLKKLLNMLMS